MATTKPHRDIFRPPTTKNVFFYRAGDSENKSVRIPVNRHNYRTLDALLDDLSHRIPQLSFGARRLCTPSGIHEVSDIDQLRHQQSYVCTDKIYSKVTALDRSKSFTKPTFSHSGTDFKLFSENSKSRLPPLSKSLTNLKKENTSIGEKLVKASRHVLMANSNNKAKLNRTKSFNKSDSNLKLAKKPPVPKLKKKVAKTTEESVVKPNGPEVINKSAVKRSQSESESAAKPLEDKSEMIAAGLIFSPPDPIEQVKSTPKPQSRQSTAQLRKSGDIQREFDDTFAPHELAAKIEQLDEADLNIIEDDGVSFFNSVPNSPKRAATPQLVPPVDHMVNGSQPQSPVDHFDVETLRSLSAPSTPREKHLVEDNLAPLDTNRIRHLQRGRVAGKQIVADKFIFPDEENGKFKSSGDEKKPLSGETVRIADSGVSLKAY